MIFLAVAAPTPGRASRSFCEALLRSTGAVAAAGAAAGAAALAVLAAWAGTAARGRISASPSSAGRILVRKMVIGSSYAGGNRMGWPGRQGRATASGSLQHLGMGGIGGRSVRGYTSVLPRGRSPWPSALSPPEDSRVSGLQTPQTPQMLTQISRRGPHVQPRSLRGTGSALLVLLTTAGLPPVAPAQPPTAPFRAEKSGFSERIDVRAVDVEVVVTDAKGQRVHGLKAEDFRLFVDGRAERIDSFAEVTDRQATPLVAAPPATVATSPSTPATPAAPPPPPGAAGGGRVGTSYLVFIDDAFSISGQRNATLSTLQRDLALLGPGDRMAVVAYDGRDLAVLSTWTGDPAVLKQAFAQAGRRKTHGGRMMADRRGDQRSAGIDAQDLYGDADLLRVVPGSEVATFWQFTGGVGRAATAAAAALRGLPLPPGRRVMMVLAGGWPWDGDPRALLPLTTAANLLGYTLYPVHVPGFDPLVQAAADVESQTVSISADSRYMYTPPIVTGWERSAEAALKALARATGGVAALNRNHALRQVMEDTRSYYWLGFSPLWKADDRPHAITVQVRRPGLTARSRRSFFDLAEGTSAALTAESLFLLGGDPARKRLTVSAGEARQIDRKTLELPLTVLVPAEALTVLPAPAGTYGAEARLSLAVRDEAGGRAELPGRTLRATLPEAPRAGSLIRLRTALRLRRARQRLIVSVQDAASGALLWGDLDVRP